MGLAVVALGGNALQPPGEPFTVEGMRARARVAAASAVRLAAGTPVVVTHGNGPQVGAIFAAQPGLPLWLAVAESQGQVGSILAVALREAGLRSACVLTHVVVDAADPAFRRATKPIGPFVGDAEADRLRRAGVPLVRVAGRWRHVVPSPKPLEVVEAEEVRVLLASGVSAIAAGGGGVPVTRAAEGLVPVDAVIDKDAASALLARQLGAGALHLLTDVPRVCLDFGTPRERGLDVLRAADARRLLAEGQFPEGSMGPKVEAALEFLAARPDGAVRIGSLEDPLHGTRVLPG